MSNFTRTVWRKKLFTVGYMFMFLSGHASLSWTNIHQIKALNLTFMCVLVSKNKPVKFVNLFYVGYEKQYSRV